MYDESWQHCRKQDLSPYDLKRISDKTTPGSTVLDAGCGDGYLLKNLSDKCSHLIGVDISTVALSKARKRIGDNVILVQALLEDLPFRSSSIDIVVSAHTIEHVKDIDKSISELKRIAKHRLVILVPCQEYLPYTEDYHLHFFPTEKDLLDRVGIANAHCERYSVVDEGYRVQRSDTASKGDFDRHYINKTDTSKADCNYLGEVLLLTADL
ncbi:MAG: class I SAM-dependent methyltransferase [Candidatus Hatepunaea meridiana]|nr:class I SAM-dependent methyltransferase [Candidatus Hatepunaea meridiana]